MTPAVREISFTVEPGERVAIVGPSGAGKSTLVALLARLYDPQQGRILIDGQDVRAYRLEALRREVGFVLQDTMLFAGTVRDNVRFGKLDATAGEIEESCGLANAHEFIARLPGGYDAQVGERGVQLSGGQRQRIGIARVLLRRPDLDTGRVERDIRERLGFEGPILTFEHHHSHAASAFFYSGEWRGGRACRRYRGIGAARTTDRADSAGAATASGWPSTHRQRPLSQERGPAGPRSKPPAGGAGRTSRWRTSCSPASRGRFSGAGATTGRGPRKVSIHGWTRRSRSASSSPRGSSWALRCPGSR